MPENVRTLVEATADLHSRTAYARSMIGPGVYGRRRRYVGRNSGRCPGLPLQTPDRYRSSFLAAVLHFEPARNPRTVRRMDGGVRRPRLIAITPRREIDRL